MGKYLFKRIIYSIFSIVCVMIIMIFLLFTLKDKEAIFAGDPYITTKSGNEKEYYKNTKWEKYGYLDLINFSQYIDEQFADSMTNEEYEKAQTLPNDEEDESSNEYVAKFTEYYSSRGYTVHRLYAEYYRGEIKKGYNPYLFATKNKNTFERLWDFFSDMFTVETINDVDNYCESNDLEPARGYYLVNDTNGWNEFKDYWGASNFSFTYESSESDENTRVFAFSAGVFEDELDENGQYQWSVVYLNDGVITEICDKFTITEIGEYDFYLEITKDADGNDVYNAYSSKSKTQPVTRREKGTKYAIENKGIKIIWDSYSNMPALVGNGTTHKYLIYFDNNFPFVHQNIIHFSLGYSNDENSVLSKYFDATGEITATEQEYPAQLGTGNKVSTANNFHTASFNYSKALKQDEVDLFGSRYTSCEQNKNGVSRLAYSFLIGIIATVISYVVGIPLGILDARKKETWVDKLGICYIIFIIAVPSLAYIYMITAIGSSLGLPNNFAKPTDVKWLVYVLPVISLAMPGIAGEIKWVRRYMIDQENSDYVKFARSQGLSEHEIFSKHISKNAIIPIVHGIPGAIIGCLSGAFVTEKVYAIPGTGGLLVNAISGTDNGLILGATFLFATLSIISLILGDILLTIIDPRISFTSGGRK